jgi:hypothetical protein
VRFRLIPYYFLVACGLGLMIGVSLLMSLVGFDRDHLVNMVATAATGFLSILLMPPALALVEAGRA